MRWIGAAIALLPTLAGCAHFSAPAGWDCRASVEQGGIRADGWLHLGPTGRVQVTQAQWWQQRGRSPVLRFGGVWEGSAAGVDWNAGRVELIYAFSPPSLAQPHRLELHGRGRRILSGAWDRGPNLGLSAPYRNFNQAAGEPNLVLVVVSQAGREIARRPFYAGVLQRGTAMAAEALVAATRKSSDYRQHCEPAPEIIPT